MFALCSKLSYHLSYHLSPNLSPSFWQGLESGVDQRRRAERSDARPAVYTDERKEDAHERRDRRAEEIPRRFRREDLGGLRPPCGANRNAETPYKSVATRMEQGFLQGRRRRNVRKIRTSRCARNSRSRGLRSRFWRAKLAAARPRSARPSHARGRAGTRGDICRIQPGKLSGSRWSRVSSSPSQC